MPGNKVFVSVSGALRELALGILRAINSEATSLASGRLLKAMTLARLTCANLAKHFRAELICPLLVQELNIQRLNLESFPKRSMSRCFGRVVILLNAFDF